MAFCLQASSGQSAFPNVSPVTPSKRVDLSIHHIWFLLILTLIDFSGGYPEKHRWSQIILIKQPSDYPSNILKTPNHLSVLLGSIFHVNEQLTSHSFRPFHTLQRFCRRASGSRSDFDQNAEAMRWSPGRCCSRCSRWPAGRVVPRKLWFLERWSRETNTKWMITNEHTHTSLYIYTYERKYKCINV